MVKIKPFTEVAADVAAYGPVEDESGKRRFSLRITGTAKGQVIAAIEGVSDRDAALALKGERLYVDRAALPDAEEGSYYHADLIGLVAVTVEGDRLGTVSVLHDFGAGDLVEIKVPEGRSVLLPFNATVVPEVDLVGGRLVVDPPDGMLE